MRPLRTAIVALAAFGCSGPYEHMNPPIEPDLPETVATSEPGTGPVDCLPEGEEIVATDGGKVPECCEGLVRAGSYKGSILRLDECQLAEDGRAFCIRCGDGRCGAHENVCTCKSDCEWPPTDPAE